MYYSLNDTGSITQTDIINRSKESRILRIINYICAIYIVVYIVSPPLKTTNLYLYILIFTIFLWFFTAIFRSYKFFFLPNRIVTPIYFFIAYVFTMFLISSNSVFIKRFFGLYVFLLIQIMYWFYRKYFENYIFKLTKLVLFLMPIFSIITLCYAWSSPYLIRRVITKGSIYHNYMALGVGGYDLVYAYVIIVPACIYLLKYRKRISRSWLLIYLVNSVIGTVLIIKAGFTIALLTLVVSLLIILNIKKMDIKGIIILMIFGINEYLSLPYLRTSLCSFAKNTPYESKIDGLLNFFIYGGDIGYSYDIRYYVYSISVKGFLDNCFFGTIYSGNVLFGNHSTILDIFSIFGGIIGFLLIYILFATPLTFLKKFRNIKSNILIWASVFSLSMILVFDNDVPLLGIAMYFVLHTALNEVLPNRLKHR